jgi:hypothetical protein
VSVNDVPAPPPGALSDESSKSAPTEGVPPPFDPPKAGKKKSKG